MFVVADQPAVRIGRERRLAGAREAEEERDVRRILLVHVRRAVHREALHVGEVVVHRVEDRLLHLARVSRAEDEHHASLERLHDADAALQAEFGRIVDAHRAAVDDDPIRLESLEVVADGVDEEGLREERVPRLFRDDRHLQAVLRIGAGVAVKPVQLFARREVFLREGFKLVEVGGRDRLVDLAPVDVAVDAGRVLEELVVQGCGRCDRRCRS
jgi:hypothetical protein